MKLRRDDVVRAGAAAPLELFARGMRAEATSRRYGQALRQVLCGFLEEVLEGTLEECAAQMVRLGRDDPEWARDLLVSLAWKLRGRTRLDRDDPDYLSPASVPNYFKPLKKMLDMNDMAVNWKRAYAAYPEPDGMAGSAGWARGEIAAMMRHARSAQERALILVLASSGVRAGALPDLNWGDLKPVYLVDGGLVLDPGDGPGELACAMLEVYRGSAESYTAFVTPEAFEALQEYGREWSELMGRRAGSGDPMFISTRGKPGRAARATIRKRGELAARRAGLRGGGREGKRHEVPLMNSFRRFYNKTAKTPCRATRWAPSSAPNT